MRDMTPTEISITNALDPNGHDGAGAKAKPSAVANELRRLSISPAPHSHTGRLSPAVPQGPPYYHHDPLPDLQQQQQQHQPADPPASPLGRSWAENKPSILVALSQFFGALMNLSARLLEGSGSGSGSGIHPVQLLLLRQAMTVVGCCAYMRRAGTPDFPFGRREIRWLLFLSLGVWGFIMQYLLTAGLAADKSNRANAMIYRRMLFALAFDWWVFGHGMELVSFAGCALIMGSAVTVVLMRRPPAPKAVLVIGISDVERQGNVTGEAEGSPMLLGVGGDHTDEIHLEGGSR